MKLLSALSLFFCLVACGQPPPAAEPPAGSRTADAAAQSAVEALPAGVSQLVFQKWTGDLEGMIERRMIRAGVVFSRTHYFIDKGVQRGAAYESLKLFEDELNTKLGSGNLKVNVVFVPLPRDELFPALLDGRVDLLAAMLTVTPERRALVDFSEPTRTNVAEIVVTGPGAPALASLEDLAGQEVFVRQTSSYYQSLEALNERFRHEGRPEVVLQLAPEALEDDDLLEMVNAGLVRIVVVDDYQASFWKQVLPDLTLHEDLALRTGGELAVAMRKDSPRLMAAANDWIAEHGPRTMFGNMMLRRYLQGTTYVRSATSEAERQRLLELVELFRKYGDQYELDYLLMAAQGYQESGLDHRVRSPVGAIGVMQVMPATGEELAVGDIEELEPNIHAGVKYIRFMIDQYFSNEPMDPLDKALFAFASYNAGPARIRRLREEAESRGLDPDIWFGNVERIASERIGRETVQYVSNIFKYYIAYRLVSEERTRSEAAKAAVSTGEAR